MSFAVYSPGANSVIGEPSLSSTNPLGGDGVAVGVGVGSTVGSGVGVGVGVVETNRTSLELPL